MDKYHALLLLDSRVAAPPSYESVIERATALGYTLPSPAQQINQKTLMDGLISSGLINAFDSFYFWQSEAGTDDFRRIDWKRPSRLMDWDTPPPVVPNVGLYMDPRQLAGFGYLQSNYNPSVDGVQYTRNNAGVYFNSIAGYPPKGMATGLDVRCAGSLNIPGSNYRINTDVTFSNFTIPVANYNGLMSMRRVSSVGIQFWHDLNVVATSTSHPSTGVPLSPLKMLGYWFDNVTYYPECYSVPLQCLIYGRNLTSEETTTLKNLLDAYSANYYRASLLSTSGNYTVPVGVTQLKVECFGAGGPGRGYANVAQTTTGAGGGGGAYASSVLTVVPGAIIPFLIGAAGVGNTAAGTAGGDTSWNAGQVLAKGGGITPSNTVGGPGGLASASVGDVKFDGGAGGAGGAVLAWGSGSGGSAASQVGVGANGQDGQQTTTSRAGSNPLGPGYGGVGLVATANANGNAGVWGSGGSGARRTTTTKNGGNGGLGFIRVSY